ncbi:hypothetical protein JGH11_04500 [Dysgonomonas sp. Marseille-P4677]|uniref:hypothetical protein n=1 Tax=Dysgonomonas sp. Marseille-P4677 TaxID=2364790 RepID=UPI0019138B61|nr:hypothetical protein [Dysgonomonas sp. Marseille-P4677]MBK5720127.1 hypothetical protein [Dysgonomonas sp. Marseille-P4677]
MPKFLTDKEFERLTNRSAMLDSIVAAVVKTNPELKAEDVTAELIIQALTSTDNASDPGLQSKFDALQEQYDGVVSERDNLQSQVDNLLNGAAEDSASITSDSEVTAKPATLLDIAKNLKGDTAAIINAAIEDGFLPKQN